MWQQVVDSGECLKSKLIDSIFVSLPSSVDLQKYDYQGIITVIALTYPNICGSFRLSTPLGGSASLQPATEYHVVEWG